MSSPSHAVEVVIEHVGKEGGVGGGIGLVIGGLLAFPREAIGNDPRGGYVSTWHSVVGSGMTFVDVVEKGLGVVAVIGVIGAALGWIGKQVFSEGA